MIESDILHETQNLYLVRVRSGLEIRLNTNTHSICIGCPKNGLGSAIATMEKLEKYPDNLRRMYK